jgi:hypothetical protein
MAHAKQPSRGQRLKKTAPMVGLAGLSLVGGATTAIGGPAANMPTQATVPSHEITLGEEEISDVSLATFYVFDKEHATAQPDLLLAAGGCGGRGCGGRGGGCGGRGGGCGGRACGVGGCGGGCRGCGVGGCGGRGCGIGGCGCWGGCGCGCCLSWGGCGLC